MRTLLKGAALAAVLLLAGCSGEPYSNASKSEPARKAPAVPTGPIPALAAYNEMYKVARAWSADAMTASLTGTFVSPANKTAQTPRQAKSSTSNLKAMAEVKLLNEALIGEVAARARASARRRMNYNFHTGPEDNPHRFLNVLLEGSYIRPHRHLHPPKAESFLVLEGEAEVLLFDNEGAITNHYTLGAASPEGYLWGIDLPPGIWHTVIARTARAVCFEVKPGPWLPATDKEFAPWAPPESAPDAPAYLRFLTQSVFR